jgi:hypothetical protein
MGEVNLRGLGRSRKKGNTYRFKMGDEKKVENTILGFDSQ